MPDLTLEDVEKQYDAAMEAAKAKGNKPDVLNQLRVERDNAIAEIRLRDAAARELALAKREALLDFPLAREVQEYVLGDTEDAIKASAQHWHERIEGLVEKHHRGIEVRKLVEAQMKLQNPKEGGDDPDQAVQQP